MSLTIMTLSIRIITVVIQPETKTYKYFNSHHEQCTHDSDDYEFFEEWGCWNDYESGTETHDYLDDWDQKCDEPNIQQPILSTMTDDLGNTVAAHLLDSDIDDSPPLTDGEYPSKDETEKEDGFVLPGRVPYPLLRTLTM